MSSMLQQAIIDASALREAAVKNAEAAIIEKYTHEIKNAVDSLLEQEEELGLEEDPLAMEEPGAEEAPAAVPEAPAAHTEGENLCPCPEDEEEVEIVFDELASQFAAEQDVGKSHEELAGGIPQAAPPTPLGEGNKKEEEVVEEELVEEGDENVEISEELLKSVIFELTEDENVELDDDKVKEIAEKLAVDIKVVPNAPNAAAQFTPSGEQEHAADLELAAQQDDELAEENDELKKAVKELEENIKDLKTENKRYKDTVLQLKDKFDEVNLSNAKLLYTNRVLESTSLNERQKEQIVETLSNASSISEAKVIFETLQSTVGASTKKTPQSLSEAVTRGASTMLPRRQKRQNVNDPTTTRWRQLAGIEK